jgi:LPPG:FO 2-phospho-L-lactate transferase
VRVVCLSGGVGGAKLARGLHDVLGPGELTVIGNVGDDVEVLGLHVSPDLDSVLYALAGLNDEERGWGRAGESWRTLGSAKAWGGDGWFLLGDLDLGLHLVRTQALRRGETLSAVRRTSLSRPASRRVCSRRRTTSCGRRSSRRPGRSRFRSGSSGGGTRTRSTG